nr:PBECR2 nuclease fold domain-containing protein [Afifella sp. H1R]
MPSGPVYLSIPAQQHAFRRHRETFPACLPFLSEIVRSPDYIGQSPHHRESGFELIGEVEDNSLIVLIAIRLQRDGDGRYLVRSFYPIDRNKLDRRLRKGFVTRTK